jgi:hypothetical protein
MTALQAVWEVARRELIVRSRSRAMRISLVVLLVVSVGGAVAAARLSGRTPTDNIGGRHTSCVSAVVIVTVTLLVSTCAG